MIRIIVLFGKALDALVVMVLERSALCRFGAFCGDRDDGER